MIRRVRRQDARDMTHNRPPLLKPPALKPGDTIGIISPAGAFLGREGSWKMMQAYLEGLGYRVKSGKNAQVVQGYTAGSDLQRLEDLHAMWEDPSVKAVIGSQGGFGSMHLLNQIDYQLLVRYPKILMGYSDLTALLMGVHSHTGMVVFHGPMAVSDFGFGANPFTASQCWKLLNGEANRQIPYTLENAYQAQYQTLRSGAVEGPLYAGNLQLLSSLVGTGMLPDLTGAILLIEDVGSFIYIIDRMLTQLALSGVLSRLGGLLFGEFFNLMEANPIIPLNIQGAPSPVELCRRFADTLSIPVGYGFSCGHGLAKSTLPLGMKTRFDADAGTLTLLESYLDI